MIWESWSDFFAMGGYGLYVWGSVLVVFGCMLWEVLALSARRKALTAQLKTQVLAQVENQRKAQRGGRQ